MRARVALCVCVCVCVVDHGRKRTRTFATACQAQKSPKSLALMMMVLPCLVPPFRPPPLPLVADIRTRESTRSPSLLHEVGCCLVLGVNVGVHTKRGTARCAWFFPVRGDGKSPQNDVLAIKNNALAASCSSACGSCVQQANHATFLASKRCFAFRRCGDNRPDKARPKTTLAVRPLPRPQPVPSACPVPPKPPPHDKRTDLQ